MEGKAVNVNVPTFHFGKTCAYRGDQIAGYSEIPAQIVLNLTNGDTVRLSAPDETKDFRTQRPALNKWLESDAQRKLPMVRTAGSGGATGV
jgi:hypothetical protein